MKNLLLVLVGLLILTSCNDNIEYIATLEEGVTLRDTNIARLETMITLYQAKCDDKIEKSETKHGLIEQRIHLTTKRYEAEANYITDTLLDHQRYEVMYAQSMKHLKDYEDKLIAMRKGYRDFTRVQKELNIDNGSVDDRNWLKKIRDQVIKVEMVKLDLQKLPRQIELTKLERKNVFESKKLEIDKDLKIINYKLELISQKVKVGSETQVDILEAKASADAIRMLVDDIHTVDKLIEETRFRATH